MITITQFSDTHFSRPGHRSHGGFGYDTDLAWDTAFRHAFVESTPTDLTVVTGDITDNGETDEYLIAVGHLSRVPTPTNVLAGNHDFQVPLETAVPRPGLTMDRVQRVGPWLFIFVDTNYDGRTLDENGRLVDRSDRRQSKGSLGPAERAWITEVVEVSDAAHVWLWLHHAPAVPGAFHSEALNDDVQAILAVTTNVRGIGAGHVHTSIVTEIGRCPVYICPALTVNIDMDNWTTLPPGYRTYRFHDDGAVESDCHLLVADIWPRFPLPDQAVRRLKGESHPQA